MYTAVVLWLCYVSFKHFFYQFQQFHCYFFCFWLVADIMLLLGVAAAAGIIVIVDTIVVLAVLTFVFSVACAIGYFRIVSGVPAVVCSLAIAGVYAVDCILAHFWCPCCFFLAYYC
jgi:hypothetical protein